MKISLIASVLVLGWLFAGCSGTGAGAESSIEKGAKTLSPISVTSSKSFAFSEKKTRGMNSEGVTEKEVISYAIVNNLKPDEFIQSNYAEFPLNIKVYEGEFISEEAAFFFMKSMEKDLASTCGRDSEGFAQIFYCGDIQLLRAGNKVEILEAPEEIYFNKISGNHSAFFINWNNNSKVEVYLPLYPLPQ